jgi:hypothetical protein
MSTASSPSKPLPKSLHQGRGPGSAPRVSTAIDAHVNPEHQSRPAERLPGLLQADPSAGNRELGSRLAVGDGSFLAVAVVLVFVPGRTFAGVTKNVRGDQVGWHRLPSVPGHRDAEVSGSRTVPPLSTTRKLVHRFGSRAGGKDSYPTSPTPRSRGNTQASHAVDSRGEAQRPTGGRNGDCR